MQHKYDIGQRVQSWTGNKGVIVSLTFKGLVTDGKWFDKKNPDNFEPWYVVHWDNYDYETNITHEWQGALTKTEEED